MKIAHFSDLHICVSHRKDHIRLTRVAIEYALKNDCDHIVITGDLSQMGSRRDYEVLRSIFEDYGLLDPNKLSLTIGNHDIFGGVQWAEDIVAFPKFCRATDFNQRVHRFFDFFKETFEDAQRPDDDHPFPFAKVVQDVVFYGINSSIEYSMIKNPMASNGLVSKIKRKQLNDLFALDMFRDKLKIVLIHHHFYNYVTDDPSGSRSWWNRIESQTMKLYKKRKLLKLFAQHGVGLVLHGHVHEYRRYKRRGITLLNGAGCFADKWRQHLEMNMIVTAGKHVEIERCRFPSALQPLARSTLHGVTRYRRAGEWSQMICPRCVGSSDGMMA
jgi:3',5'-cyclic AMP phosphodiesterase CpdA